MTHGEDANLETLANPSLPRSGGEGRGEEALFGSGIECAKFRETSPRETNAERAGEMGFHQGFLLSPALSSFF